jgi:hypothetical protein
VTRRAIVLSVVPLGFAVLIGMPLGLWLGPYQWLCAGIAVGLTIPPGVITLILADRLSNSSPAAQVAALAFGPVVRMLIGFGGAVLVFKLAQPTFQADPLSFWGWVLGAYLTTLIVETAMLGRKVSERPA